MPIIQVNGVKPEKSRQYDKVSLQWGDGNLLHVRSVDGYYRDAVTATLDLKGAKKLMDSLKVAIEGMEATAHD